MKKIFTMMFLWMAMLAATAQNNTAVRVNYTTIGLYNIDRSLTNWVNLLDVQAGQPLWSGAQLNVDLFAANNLRNSKGEDCIFNELSVFSAIEDESVALSLFMFSLSQQIGAVQLSFGVRNVNNDYFASPLNSLFTSSQNGLFPVLTNNYNITDCPMSALALHGEWQIDEHLMLKSSLYNGRASERWDEVFRFRPGRDGLFSISEISFGGSEESMQGNYYMGFAWGNTPLDEECARDGKIALYGMVEQPLFRLSKERSLQLLLHAAVAPHGLCDSYLAAGCAMTGLFSSDDYAGVLFNHTTCLDSHEHGFELTYGFSPCKGISVQPAYYWVCGTDCKRNVLSLTASYEF